MRALMMLFSLVLACLATVNVEGATAKKHPLAERFQKMDTNHDGILTLGEFIAGHPKMGTTQATAAYKELVTLGGTTTKNGVTGMTFPQFKKAHKLWKQSHQNQGQKQNGTT